MAERVQPVIERAGGDDIAVSFGRRVDIVVVVIEPGLGELVCLAGRQHAQRHAGFHAHRGHALHDLDDRGHVALLGVAPGCAHAEALAARILCAGCALQHFAHVHQLGRHNTAVSLH